MTNRKKITASEREEDHRTPTALEMLDQGLRACAGYCDVLETDLGGMIWVY